MKNRLLSVVLCFTIALTGCISCFAQTDNANEDVFKIVHISYPTDGADYDWRAVIKARYADTKEPIPLSDVYDNRLYATVPVENAEREIEAFKTEEIAFLDYDIIHYEFHPMQELSRTGVITGNEKGEALPFDNITRAEATAMVMRLLGLNTSGEYEVPFTDVSKNEWYYNMIACANKYGIATGDSNTIFSPDRNVTREEITVMAARAVKLAGLGFPGNSNMNAKDVDKISDWAKEAYNLIGNYANSDYDDTDIENYDNPTRLIKPQSFATRYDVADVLYNISLRCTVYPSQIAQEFGFDEEIPVIDGSTSTYPFTQVVYSTLFSNGWNHPSMPQKHSKSHATYQKLINGEIDMMFASVYPASDILKMAEEKGVELELIPIAYDAMIFFTNNDNSAEGLTSEQISEIYVNNAYSNWNELGGPDALLYPYCRNNDSGSHAQMEKHFLNGNEINEDIRRESTSMAMASVLTDVIAAKTDNPTGYGLGYSIYYYYHNADAVLDSKRHLKLLSVDGVYPDDDTIADGSYPLSNNTYAVLRKDTPKDAPARKMAEFMLTDIGQMCVESAGFGKLKR